MKKFVLGFLVTIVLLPLVVIGGLRLGLADVNADVNAPAWQSRLLHFAEHASVRRSAANLHSPLSHTDAELIAGGTIYLNSCAGCHGRPGRPPRKRPWFFAPTQLAHVATQYSEPEAYWVIKHGLRRTGMYASSYGEQKVWLLAAFVRRLKDLPPPVLDAIQAKKQ